MSEKLICGFSFDLDDTLFNSFPYAAANILAAGRVLGYNSRSEQDVKALWGSRFPDMIYSLWPEMPKSSWNDFFDIVSKFDRENPAQPFDGVSELLLDLKNAGHLIGITTSRTAKSAERMCSELGLGSDFFLFQQYGCSTPHCKQDPEAFAAPIGTFQEYDVPLERIVHIGDSPLEMVGAQAAGLKFYAVTTGPAGKEDFLEQGLQENYVLDSVLDLPRNYFD